MSSQRERRLLPPILYRYVPNHLGGMVAVLLFLVALVLGAAVAVVLSSLL